MNLNKKKKIKNIAIFSLLGFILFLYILAIYFAIIGNSTATISIFVFNSTFLVILYFLMKLHKYIKSNDDYQE